MARPFNIATKEEVSEVTQDFIDYILSEEGQEIVSDNGYISLDDVKPYAAASQKERLLSQDLLLFHR